MALNFIIKEVIIMNFHNKKTQKVISTIIIIVLVLAMVVPMALSVMY